MLINKLREAADFKDMEGEVPSEYLKKVTENTPEYLLGIMAEVVSVLLSRLKLPQEEVDGFTGQIKERKMGELFTHFKGYDVPAMRIKIREELRDEVKKEVKNEIEDEVREEVKDKVREEVKNEIKDEVREEVKDEVREEVKNEIKEETKEKDIRIFIEALKDLGISKENIEIQLMDKYLLRKEKAEEKLNLYW